MKLNARPSNIAGKASLVVEGAKGNFQRLCLIQAQSSTLFQTFRPVSTFAATASARGLSLSCSFIKCGDGLDSGNDCLCKSLFSGSIISVAPCIKTLPHLIDKARF